MTVEHKDILDPNIHEPKGVSTASSNQIYVANGSGSGSWVTPPYHSPVYAEIDKAAAVVSLTGSSEILIGGFVFDDAELTKFSLTSGSRLTVQEAGLYKVTMGVTIIPQTALGATNEVVNALLKINSTTPPASRTLPITVIRNSATTDPFTISMNRIIDISAGDFFELFLLNTSGTRSYSVAAGLNFLKFGEL